MHKTEKRAKESCMNLMYSYLCDRTLARDRILEIPGPRQPVRGTVEDLAAHEHSCAYVRTSSVIVRLTDSFPIVSADARSEAASLAAWP